MRRVADFARNPFVVLVLVAGTAASLLAGHEVRHQGERRANEWLAARGELIVSATRQTVDEAIKDLTAVAAFFEGSEHVTQDEYRHFLDRLTPSSGLVAIAHIPIVAAEDAAAFTAAMREEVPGYGIVEPDPEGGVVPTRPRDVYHPVQHFAPGEYLAGLSAVGAAGVTPGLQLTSASQALGVDVGTDARWREGLAAAIANDAPAITDFVPIAELGLGKVFVLIVPVREAGGQVSGVVAAPALDVLLAGELGQVLAREVDWDIDAPGSFEVAGRTWVGSVEVADRTWEVSVKPTAESEVMIAPRPGVLATAGGLALTVLAALALHFGIQRARAVSRMRALEESVAEKDRFLAVVSHELRTPLTAASGLAHELLDRPGDFDDDETRSLLQIIVEQSDEVVAIIEDLLVAARSDIGALRVGRERVDLREAAQHVAVPDVAARAQVLGGGEAWGDPRRVRQVIRNLLTNAARHGGRDIRVECDVDGRWAEVAVSDDGAPIPEPSRQAIFQPYTSLAGDRSPVGSIGLGLYISRRLAELMGGRLDYSHTGDRGVFTLRLPVYDSDRALESAEMSDVSV